jgi:transcription initiation factor IIE alpha subunit
MTIEQMAAEIAALELQRLVIECGNDFAYLTQREELRAIDRRIAELRREIEVRQSEREAA